VLERVAQPLAAGIYTADPTMLSVAATMPRFVEMERRYGSVIRGLRAAALGQNANARGTSGARWSLFVSFKGGVRAVVDALRSRLRDSIRSGAPAVALERVKNDLNSGAWRLRFADGSGFDTDAIVCAVPAYAAARLLKPHCVGLATILEGIGYASAATVNLAFREIDFPQPPTCFGFVVPAAEKRKIIAASFSSLKFAGRAPAGMILVRVFLGGALQTEMMALDDAAMVAAAREEFAALLGVAAEPRFSYVRRWPNAMPQYHVGHLEGVSEIEREAGKIAGFAIAGAFLRGVGIPDCIRSGEAAAEAVFSRITNGT
jgi:oxygen-dependent protoporphyrinogen oxidase